MVVYDSQYEKWSSLSGFNQMTRLIGPINQIGKIIQFELPEHNRVASLSAYLDESRLDLLIKQFAKDFIVESFIEKLSSVDIYYLTTEEGRGDELYYFAANGFLYHGEKVWSEYHPFVFELEKIKPSAHISELCAFVGSRNNYTHQLLDFFPSHMILQKYMDTAFGTQVPSVFGRSNSILEQICIATQSEYFNQCLPLFLSDYGTDVNVGCWKVRCIRFARLLLVRHLSIYKSYSTLYDALMRNISLTSNYHIRQRHTIAFLTRGDQRIINEQEIVDSLQKNWNCQIISDLSTYSYAQKADLLKAFDVLVLPPGSDNINAFLFAKSSARFVQLIPASFSEMIENPFYSFASLRYMLPFLERITVVKPTNFTENVPINSGVWNICDLDFAIEAALSTIKQVLASNGGGLDQ